MTNNDEVPVDEPKAPGIRQTMSDLHTWAGLLCGWFLYAMFLTGTVSYFKDEISHHGAECCNYLLANDIDMEPVPGYKATSWDKGYGDFVLKPDLNTLRRTPWLPGTALVLCDVLDHHTHEDVPHSPRGILKRQIARLSEHLEQVRRDSMTDALTSLANRKAFRACTDLGDGGLALAAFEMAEGAGLGLTLEAGDIPTLFGEDQARYLIATSSADALLAAGKAAGVPVAVVGRFGGETVSFGGDTAPLAALSDLYRSAFAKAVA